MSQKTINKLKIVGWVCGLLALAVPSQAHVRNYLETYSADTLEQGRSEVELHTDYRKPDERASYWYHQTEAEYGITDRYTLGLYGVFREGQGFSAYKIENRYRLSEKGQWPVDTALYLEYKGASGSKDNDEFEGKILLSKDVDRWNFATNLIASKEKENKPNGETEWENETGVMMAACYRVGGVITPGVEVLFEKDQSQIIPGIYIDVMPGIRLNLGVGFGLVSEADTTQLKSLLEIEF